MIDITGITSLTASLINRMAERKKDIGVEGVYDYVPDQSPFPYICLGEIKSIDDGTKTSRGEKFLYDINLYSLNRGRRKDFQSMEKVAEVLQEELTPLEGQVYFEVVTTNINSIFSAEINKGLFVTTLTLEIRIEKGDRW